MKNWVKRNFGLIYIALLTLVLVVVLVNSGELPSIIKTLGSLEVRWVYASAALVLIYLLLRAVTLWYYLRSRGVKLPLGDALIITGIGQFYSAITPSASGGQPFQVLSMHQRGVPVSIGTAAVSIKFIAFQLSFMLIGGVMWATHVHMVTGQLGGLRVLVLVGYLINAILIVLVVLTMVYKTAVDRLVRWLINLGVKLRLVRDRDKTWQKVSDMLGEYRQSLLTLRDRPIVFVNIMLITIVYVTCYMLIVVCIYHAFRLNLASDSSILTLQFLLFITAAFVPLPGAAGAQEGGFYLFFQGIVPSDNLVPMMVCWRFFTFYMLLLSGLLAVIIDGATLRMRRRRNGQHNQQ